MNKLINHIPSFVPPTGGVQPPGTENVTTVIQWAIWIAAALLFVYFIAGIVKAGRARRAHDEAEISAPAWPLVAAIVLGAANTIWVTIA